MFALSKSAGEINLFLNISVTSAHISTMFLDPVTKTSEFKIKSWSLFIFIHYYYECNTSHENIPPKSPWQYSVLLWGFRPFALCRGKTHFGEPNTEKSLERVLLCAFIMNHALGPLFLFCCKFLFEMEFLKRPYLSKGFCTRKPILIRLSESNLLQSWHSAFSLPLLQLLLS